MTTVEQLRATRVLITDPKHFSQDEIARDYTGRACKPLDTQACSWCVLGAWQRTINVSGPNAGYNELKRLCNAPVLLISDFHGHKAVLKMLDKAIERAEYND
jgi:hypothetical protein